MRAARLLRMLLLLQSRGRLTSVELAAELEVAQRTILRDVDALTEAGVPVIVHRGNQGGIELGFNYRTRLTGLAADEAEALGVILNRPAPELAALGMADAAARARAKLIGSLAESTRGEVEAAARRFRFEPAEPPSHEPLLAALAGAIREARLARVRKTDGAVVDLLPTGLTHGPGGWRIIDARGDAPRLALKDVESLQISGPGTASPEPPPR